MRNCPRNDRAVLCAAAVLSLVWGMAASAADWPRLHGPDGSGTSPEQGLARTWPRDGPRVLWTTSVGEGWSGPVVHSGEVFLLDRVRVGSAATAPASSPTSMPVLSSPGPKQDILRCFDLAGGREKWRLTWEVPGDEKPQIGQARSVPAVDEERVYALCPTGELRAVDRKTGKQVWAAHMVKDFPGCAADLKSVSDARYTAAFSEGRSNWRRYGRVPQWGFTHCPLVYRDLVIVAAMTEKAGLVAFEKATGRKRWISPFVGREFFSHSSPMVMTLLGVDQVVFIANKTYLPQDPALISSVTADTGKLLWQTSTWKKLNVPIPMPLKIGDDRVFISGGYRLGCGILKVASDAGRWSTEYTLHSSNDCTAHIQTPVFLAGHIYAQSYDEYHNRDVPNNGLVCMDAEGKLMWKTGPDQLFDNGNIIGATGMLYVLDGKTGEVCLIEASPKACVVLGRAKVLAARGGKAWAPMVLSEQRLLLRDLNEMKCLDVR